MALERELEGLQLPDGARLVHIGPSKTGTSSLQGAMWASRGEMRHQGVRYLGQKRHSGLAARAVTGMRSPYSNTSDPPPMSKWDAIVRELGRATEPRAIFSSEFLATATRDRIERIVGDLGGDQVHVAVTLRPLPRMLASRWQQGVQAGGKATFDNWLERYLGREGDLPEVRMWQAHRHDRLVQQWADVVGPDRLTAIVVDERDHGWVLRAFEALLGLREGTLALQEGAANRSLTYPEVEAVRALNIELDRLGVPQRASQFLVHAGVARRMKARTPAADEPRIVPPGWAVARTLEIARQVVAGIRSSGVRVIGDLDGLVAAPGGEASEAPDPDWMRTDVALAMAVGLLQGGGLLHPDQVAGPAELGPTKELAIATDRRLLLVYARRKRDRLQQAWRTFRGAPAPEE